MDFAFRLKIDLNALRQHLGEFPDRLLTDEQLHDWLIENGFDPLPGGDWRRYTTH